MSRREKNPVDVPVIVSQKHGVAIYDQGWAVGGNENVPQRNKRTWERACLGGGFQARGAGKVKTHDHHSAQQHHDKPDQESMGKLSTGGKKRSIR
jgi:hypothetical protein